MKVLCSKDYCDTVTPCRPVQLKKGIYYNILPTVGGYIISCIQNISFFKDSKWFEQYFDSKDIINFKNEDIIREISQTFEISSETAGKYIEDYYNEVSKKN